MHDVVRDMALWIACDIEKEKENFLVYAGVGLIEAPDVRGWEKARRLSLMHNQITDLSEIPKCPHLLTMFLNNNELHMIHNDFFQFMPSLKVINLSHALLTKLPVGISKLVSLQHLDLSESQISKLPEELKALVNLKCLNLEWTRFLKTIPRQLISNLSRLHVLRMFGASDYAFDEDNILFGGRELIVEELLGLKYLEVISFTLRSSHGLQGFLNSHKLRSCTQALLLQHFKDSTSLEVSALAELKQLNRLRIECKELEELKMDYTGEVQQFVFQSLKEVEIVGCKILKDLTFLVFAPNLESIEVTAGCRAMEEIISVGKFAEVPEVMANLNPFAKLQNLKLFGARNLKSIYWKPLPFPNLKSMSFWNCHKLKKLPLDSNSARERNIVIRGDRKWWEQLEWVDEATRNAFLLCFKS